MSRPTLRLIHKPRFTFAQRRRALVLWSGAFVTREQRKHNAASWLIANERLGAGHVLRGAEVSWGAYQPGARK